jgi:release factor glutamine methyltransferase
MTTVREALTRGTKDLAQAGQESAQLDAQILLSHVLDVERSTLYAHPERVLSPEQEQQYRLLVERRSQGEPVAYLVGHKEFYGLDFLVDRRVLIPRPETELLVDAARKVIQHMLDGGRNPIVADIGTGSGAIPVALAVHEPELPYLYATDISTDALEVARINCQHHHVEHRVRLLLGDLLAPLPEAVDIITANLPYVGSEEMHLLAPDVQAYEPHLALFSGPRGLDLVQRFLVEIQQSQKLRERGVLLLEVGYQQREPLASLLHELWPSAVVTFTKDYSGWDRVVQVWL